MINQPLEKSDEKPGMLVILGPTASGKSDLAVELALRHDGEVISADSRQVYRGLDLGTGKITSAEMRGIPHWCLDIADPRDRFTVIDWQAAAKAAMADIIARGKTPIICGGTGLYIQALVNGLEFPEANINPEMQETLESEPLEHLQTELQKLDRRRAAQIEATSNWKNPRRLARSIIIARQLGAVPPLPEKSVAIPKDITQIGIAIPADQLKKRIRERLIARLDAGMIEEAMRLHMPEPAGINLSYERMDELGLEYRYLSLFLQGQIDRNQLIEQLSAKIWQYAKRQKTWFRRDQQIRWLTPPIDPSQISVLVASNTSSL